MTFVPFVAFNSMIVAFNYMVFELIMRGNFIKWLFILEVCYYFGTKKTWTINMRWGVYN